MKKIDVGQTIAVMANVGVIAGLIFVGLQLRQAQQALDVGLNQAETNVFQELQSRLIENPEFAEVMVKARDDSSSLTPAERMQALAWLEEWLVYTASYWIQNDIGALGDRAFATRMGNECWFYYEYRDLFDEVRLRRNFFGHVDQFCTKE
jgi:hypothetical protein